MDWELFWSAFGAIGTTVGSMITSIAVVVAVYQYKQPFKKRIRISFNSGIIVFPLDDSDDEIYTINVGNTGIRPVVLTNIYFKVGNKKLVLNNLEHVDLSKTQFPCTLNQEKAVSMHISCLRLNTGKREHKCDCLPQSIYGCRTFVSGYAPSSCRASTH